MNHTPKKNIKKGRKLLILRLTNGLAKLTPKVAASIKGMVPKPKKNIKSEDCKTLLVLIAPASDK